MVIADKSGLFSRMPGLHCQNLSNRIHDMTPQNFDNKPELYPRKSAVTSNLDTSDNVDEVILFADRSGSLLEFDMDKLQRIAPSARLHTYFWQTLALNTASLAQTLKKYPLNQAHEIPNNGHQGYLLRIVPLPGALASNGGYVLVVTANHPIEAICKTYKERLDDNIAAWSDSITLFNALFDTAKDSTLLINKSGIVLTANQAALCKHAPIDQVLAGTQVTDLLGTRFRPWLQRAMKSIKGKKVCTEKVVVFDRDGNGFPAEAILRKITFSAHCLYQLILHDLTTQEELRGKKAEVEEMNITLRQVIRSVEEERHDLRVQLTNQVKTHMLPALEQVAKADSAEIRDGYISLIEGHLTGLTEEGMTDCDPELLRLSPREFRVCQLIQMGQSGKEISKFLSISFETLQTHRKNIRRKLGLRGKSTSLYQYLRQKLPLA